MKRKEKETGGTQGQSKKRGQDLSQNNIKQSEKI